jgi:PDZ domain-containing protein
LEKRYRQNLKEAGKWLMIAGLFAHGVRTLAWTQPKVRSIELMTFFKNSNPRPKVGSWAITALLVLSLGGLMALPSGYVIERPGQVFNVMGELDDKPVISATDVDTYKSETRLDITTVSLLGNRDSTPGWLQILGAWLDPDQVVLPLDEVYPPQLSTAQVRAESTAMMEVSQQDAIAAALTQLGYPLDRQLYVASVIADTPASKKLIAGDYLVAVGPVAVATYEELREQIQLSEGKTVVIKVVRDGQPKEFELTPQKKDDAWVIGAMVGYVYDFPVDIELQLGDVGGPSGGLIFALGIYDVLTEGSLGGESHIAGTGTITADGKVGPIGGIELKLIAAKKAGATLFLAPAGNCAEVVGQIPDGLSVVIVEDLESALVAIKDFNSGKPAPAISCTDQE